MRIGYFGDGPWASRALEVIARSRKFDVAFIVARFDHQDPALKVWAERLGIPFLVDANVNSRSFIDHITKFNCDLMVSMSFNQIMKDEIIRLAPRGFINCHAGALPFYRGRNPLNWALINGERAFGVTVHYMDADIDSGDVIVRQMVDIAPDDTYGDILEKAYEACSEALLHALDDIADGRAARLPQKEIHPVGFYCGRRRAGDEWIDWSLPAERIGNLVRALTLPGPGARTFGEPGVIAVLGARLIPDAPYYIGTTGEVVGRSQIGVVVKTGDSTILITRVALIDVDGHVGDPFIPAWRVGTRLGLSVIAEVHRLRSALVDLEGRMAALERAVRATPTKAEG